MLISRRGAKLDVIQQVDHAGMARDIARRWGNETFAPPIPVAQEHALLAAAAHDDGWREPDNVPLFNDEAKRPLHFLEIGMAEHIELYGRGVDDVFRRDAYAGLLVSMHWTGLYRARWGMQAGKVVFATNVQHDDIVLKEERRWIDAKRELLADARRSDLESNLWYNYELLQTWDMLSLYACLCNLEPGDGQPRQIFEVLKSIDHEPGARSIPSVPTRVGGDRVDLEMTAVQSGVIAIDPYPFDTDSVTVSVAAKRIPDRAYTGSEDARAALDETPEETIECTFVRR